MKPNIGLKMPKPKQSKFWAQVQEVLNLPPKKQAEYHRMVKRDMQLGIYNSDTERKDYIDDVVTFHTYEKGKRSKESCSVKRRWVFRKADDGYSYMMDKSWKVIQPVGCKRIYDLVQEKDGYEWLKLRKKKKGDFKEVIFDDEKEPAVIGDDSGGLI